MANINLSSSQMNSMGRKPAASNMGTIVGLIILLIVGGISAFLFFQDESLKSNVALAEKNYAAKKASLTEGRNMDVIDLQSRIFSLKELVGQRNPALDSIQNIERFLVSGVVVRNFTFNNRERMIKLECTAENHDIISKQVASFKSFEYFSEVTIVSTKVSTTGGIDFSINITSK